MKLTRRKAWVPAICNTFHQTSVCTLFSNGGCFDLNSLASCFLLLFTLLFFAMFSFATLSVMSNVIAMKARPNIDSRLKHSLYHFDADFGVKSPNPIVVNVMNAQ